ncbi:MAG: HEAT repeat domain-containing protein, partial [Planctomycetes bacterium]|nr:HEAT repeat domain-containing protein [Planctomycetota bacterium]
RGADAEVFGLLLEYPLTTDDYEPRQAVFADLGRSLVAHPEAADVLLRAYTRPQDPGPESNFGAARFAQEVFKHAGESLLPKLHASLRSPDRVVRSNAARACGAICHRSSIPHLQAALDLESGLSRASIVWALGELKAVEALPQLVTLYTDASMDQRRQHGTGYRMAQAEAQVGSQLAVISRIDEIDSEWDELKQLAEPVPIDPREDESLLTTTVILAAVQRIGTEASQDFYRRLAGESDAEARREAARRLAEGSESDRAKNVVILRGLLASQDTSVQMAAAVSLLILGETGVRSQILTWLAADAIDDVARISDELLRVADGTRLDFARKTLAERAAEAAGSPYGRQRFQTLLQRIPPAHTE